MKALRERKTISLHIRIDAVTHEALCKLQHRPGWLGASEFIRCAVIKEAIKHTQEEERMYKAIKRADEDEAESTEPMLDPTPSERYHGQPKPDLFKPGNFRPYLGLHPQGQEPTQHPLRRILPSAIEDTDNT